MPKKKKCNLQIRRFFSSILAVHFPVFFRHFHYVHTFSCASNFQFLTVLSSQKISNKMSILASPKYVSFDPKQPIFSLCHSIPSLDYDRIPNLNDIVQLTNGSYGTVIKLFFQKKRVIYHVRLHKLPHIVKYFMFLFRVMQLKFVKPTDFESIFCIGK